MELTSLQKSLFLEVAEAAETGRYCHGNGAIWNIVDADGNSVVINTMESTRSLCDQESTEKYLAHSPAYRSDNVARDLRTFVLEG